MKVSENFELEEFVSKNIFETWQAKSIWFVDVRLFIFLETLRKRMKTEMVINTWHYKEENLIALNNKFATNYNIENRLQYRGFREPACTEGTELSQHRFGRAIDFDCIGLEAETVRKELENNFSIYRLYGLSAIETNISWVHADLRFVDSKNLAPSLFIFQK
jgi:hypothetical protein